MGLDMFLKKAKRIGNVTAKQLSNIDGYFSYLDRPENCKDCTLEEWIGININDVDMSLKEKYQSEYIHRYATWDIGKQYGWKTIFTSLGSWRKANHIHNWFVNNIQNGVDDCGIYEVSKEQLEKLLNICKRVIEESDIVKSDDGKEYIEHCDTAEELLPRTSGFFFGDIEYDSWYLEDIKLTIDIIEKTLKTTDFEKEIVMYSSSW